MFAGHTLDKLWKRTAVENGSFRKQDNDWLITAIDYVNTN